ncbi:hypothetical protein [Streptomyces sp. NPDC055400]
MLEPVKGSIDAMRREDLDAPPKQKHTIPRIMERLAAKHDFGLARPTTVYDYVAKRRPQIKAEALEGRRHLEGVVPQAKRPGEEAEVDFADFWLDLAGQRAGSPFAARSSRPAPSPIASRPPRNPSPRQRNDG